MRKLILVALLLVAVLLLSWWARAANFNLAGMLSSMHPQVQSAPLPSHTPSNTPTPIPVEIIVTVTPSGFVPDVLMISAGTKITWINKSSTTANISSDPQNAFAQLNLGDFGDNGSLSLTFTTSGRYHYDNGKNPSQKGTIVVK